MSDPEDGFMDLADVIVAYDCTNIQYYISGTLSGLPDGQTVTIEYYRNDDSTVQVNLMSFFSLKFIIFLPNFQGILVRPIGVVWRKKIGFGGHEESNRGHWELKFSTLPNDPGSIPHDPKTQFFLKM